MFQLIEGGAGTGKTFTLLTEAHAHVNAGILGLNGKVLALTFMNGARKRLESNLGGDALFRGRFVCQTFDSFVRIIIARRNSIVQQFMPAEQAHAFTLGEFNGPCYLGSRLLDITSVALWIAGSFPLILVDEVQDLDVHRLQLLRRLARRSSVLACADEFQCLSDGSDTAALFSWLRQRGSRVELNQPRRTNRTGLLSVSQAIRSAGDVNAVLQSRGKAFVADGFKLLQIPAKKPLVAWTISNEISSRPGFFTILTPDGRNSIILNALDIVRARTWTRDNESTFGPYNVRSEQSDEEVAHNYLARFEFAEVTSWENCNRILSDTSDHIAVTLLNRLDRLRRLTGHTEFSRNELIENVNDLVRANSRFRVDRFSGHRLMTIHRAKNREFENVIVLWPQSATGSPEHLRRLLYNGVTRAQRHCTVIVFGTGRLNSSPFA